MEIVIHQSICGEQNKGWDLLKTTLSDISSAKKIAFQTDLQDSPPTGITWSPIIRGFLFQETFLIIKTYPDTDPDVRPGRVFSHCLMISKDELSMVSSLINLFEYFEKNINKEIHLEPIIYSPPKINTTLDKNLKLRFNKVIQEFTKFNVNMGTIVWIGQDNYDLATSKFWEILSPEQRLLFNFGIYFNPNEIPKDKINFIVVPESIAIKFDNKGYSLIQKTDSITLLNFYEQFLAGESTAIQRLNNFTTAFGINKYSDKDILLLSKGISTFERLDEITNVKLLNTLANIITKFSPDNQKGKLEKTRLIKNICKNISLADESTIFLLRNFNFTSFEDGEKEVSKSIELWLNNFLFKESVGQQNDFAQIILDVYNSTLDNWWTKLIKKCIGEFLSTITLSTIKIVWQWVKYKIQILDIISNDISKSKNVENIFLENLPDLSESELIKVKEFSLDRNWLRLYARILQKLYNLDFATSELLKVDTDFSNIEALEILFEGVKPEDIISVTLSNPDERCILISSKLCSQNPILLNRIDISNIDWQAIWLGALNHGNYISEGITDLEKKIDNFYELIVNDQPFNTNLLEKISETEFSDLLNFQNREKIWNKIPNTLRFKFLEKTSSSLLKNISENPLYKIPYDVILADYVLSHGLSTFLYYNSNNVKSALQIFLTFKNIPEHYLRDYVSNFFGNIEPIDSMQLGKLVYDRRYSSVAYVLFEKTKLDGVFRFALNECYTLLSIFHIGYLKLNKVLKNVKISKDQWWSAFAELCYKLYPNGPTQNKIWIQADGKEYDLLTRGTGKELWIDALEKLRNKVSAKITVKKLLNVIYDEYPNNDELNTLKNLWTKL